MNLWIKITWSSFVLLALSGLIMRLFPFINIHFLDFNNVLHAHSHIAILAWLYNAILLLIAHYFIKIYYKKINSSIIAYNVIILAMFISFIVQGYGLFSIVFSSMQIILSYFIAFKLRHIFIINKITIPISLKVAFYFFIFSAFLPFILAILKVLDYTPEYQNYIVNFYLYLQTSGFIFFSLLALILKVLDLNRKQFSVHIKSLALCTLFISLMEFPYIISIYEFKIILLLINLLFICVFVFFMKINTKYIIIKFLFFAMLIKSLSHFLIMYDNFNIIITNRLFVITYLHWMFLVIFSTAIWEIFFINGFIKRSYKVKYLFIFSALITVLLLMLQAIGLIILPFKVLYLIFALLILLSAILTWPNYSTYFLKQSF